MSDLLEICARDLMETAPQIVQSIRVEMRRGRGGELSIPQFRALRFVLRNPEVSLSDLADYLGLTLPSVSKLVDGLVKQTLILRQESKVDRRKMTLALTEAGETIINNARAQAQANLARTLASLPEEDLLEIHHSFELLNHLFNHH